MYDHFHAHLTELEASFKNLAGLLTQKLSAVEKFHIDRLDEIMKEEQVFVLLSKSFEKNIGEYREKLGLKSEKLGELVEELPEAERPRFREVAQRLKAALDEVKALNAKCQALIEERLYSLDKAIKELDRSKTLGYGESARPDEPPALMNKSI